MLMSDLQRKDIINMTTGSRIGKIIDIADVQVKSNIYVMNP